MLQLSRRHVWRPRSGGDQEAGSALRGFDLASQTSDNRRRWEQSVNMAEHDEQPVDVVESTLPGPRARATTADDEAAPGFPPATFQGYQIRRLLGEGAMGAVYLASDVQLDREVAIKFIKAGSGDAERFTIEARAAAKLQHPNVAAVYAVGAVDERQFIVSEYVRGQGLHTLEVPVPWAQALRIGVALSRGVAAVHRAGVLHRDIKPANIVMSESGAPKLVDFGLAKFLERDDARRAQATTEAATKAATKATTKAATKATTDNSVLGTPHYVAPEIWNDEPATARTDVYALGAVLYYLCAGYVPHFSAVSLDELQRMANQRDAPALGEQVADVDPNFAAIVDRCLARDPARRHGSADDLRDALEQLTWAERTQPLWAGNPYRGLAAFEAEHRSLFFGRDSDIRRLVDRLRSQRFVLAAGQSGVGKSSLVRAGVLPAIEERGLGDGRQWSAHTLTPGSRPVLALARALATSLDTEEGPLADALVADFMACGQKLREYHGADRGTVLFVDQLEELVTDSDPDEAAAFMDSMAYVIERTPGVRVAATVRADKVAELVAAPALGQLIERALYIVRPLDAAAIRETIIRPAQASNARFADGALVDQLVDATEASAGGLPLLQFALAELWDRMDTRRMVIEERALVEIGGVEGALARHADGVMAAFEQRKRELAEDCLVRLVTVQRMRAHRSLDYLLGGRDRRRLEVLATLVDGRLVVVQDVGGEPSYGLAHDALITSWGYLRNLLDQQGGLRAVKARLAQDAEEWHREGKDPEFLWRDRRLREAAPVRVAELPDADAAFLRASLRRKARDRWVRRFAIGIPLALVLVLVAGYLAVQFVDRRYVASKLAEAEKMLEHAHGKRTNYEQVRARAFADFRAGSFAAGEQGWAQALKLAPDAQASYADAAYPLQDALRRDAERADVRGKLAEVFYWRARLAQDQRRDDVLDDLLTRLASYDQTLADRFGAPQDVRVTTSPAGLPVSLYRYHRSADGSLTRKQVGRAERTPAHWAVPPGSYLAILAATDRTVELRYPLLLAGGRSPATREPLDVTLHVPAPARVPAGFVPVAAGRFLYGYGIDAATEPLRTWHDTLPLHERRTDGFLIARHETTYEQWLEFLRALPPDQRARRTPGAHWPDFNDALVKMREVDGTFELTLGTSEQSHSARVGQPFLYPERAERAVQDWLQFPVTGVSPRDVAAYLEWLRRERVPGARLCREDEWERAARGADARKFPHGDRLAPEDANFDGTYGTGQTLGGPDTVGQYERSESPFGVRDMVGNVSEMTAPLDDSDARVMLRSGAYNWDASVNAVVNRMALLDTQRGPLYGFRVCAPWPAPVAPEPQEKK